VKIVCKVREMQLRIVQAANLMNFTYSYELFSHYLKSYDVLPNCGALQSERNAPNFHITSNLLNFTYSLKDSASCKCTKSITETALEKP
jgi:hypothetical protein